MLKTTSQTSRQIIYILGIVLCFTPFIDPPLALLIGLILAVKVAHPFPKFSAKATGIILKVSVVGLGFGMNIHHAIDAGKDGVLFTIFSITITLILGFLIGKWAGIDKKISYLISCGTAICGGSAIAAVSPIIKAEEKQMSIALGTVFILNSVALLIFPSIGQWLSMTQQQFGMWCAIAIHDTSSVVGASAKFGEEALQIATTVKLQRALWIIPLSIITALMVKGGDKKVKIPYFIGYFILAMVISTYLPNFKSVYIGLVWLAKKGLTVTLFLIGASLSVRTVKQVGFKPLLQGIALWLVISVLSLSTIMLLN